MTLLCSHVNRVEAELQGTRNEKADALSEGERWKDRFYEEQRRTSILAERLKNAATLRHMQVFLATVGGVAAGTSRQFIVTKPDSGWAWAGTLVGLALIVAGCLPLGPKTKPDDHSARI